MPIDFLLVAALEDEAKEIERLLADVRQESLLVRGTITRWNGLGSFSVGLMDLYGMGTDNAQLATQQALAAYKPRAVLMSGIAAGFEENGVKLGDLIVPYGIVPYELQKIRRALPKSLGQRVLDHIFFLRASIEVEHRGVAWAVSEPLWRTAAATAADKTRPWLSRLSVRRPDGLSDPPSVHARVDMLVGCGLKVVAHEAAEVRKWLLACYPRQALGLEMESFGAFNACRAFETPFLMAKASVDKATREKGDDWRTYSCQLSASFLITVLERYERPVTDRVRHFRATCSSAIQAVGERLPSTNFGYCIRTAHSFEQLRRKEYEPTEADIQVLTPTEATPVVILYGGGGAGKTTMSRRVFRAALTDDQVPLLLDLKRYANTVAVDSAAATQPETIERVIRVSSIPQVTVTQISQIAAETQLLLIIDGANEISESARAGLEAICRDLREQSSCRVLWTNRVSALEGFSGPETLHATVTEVSEQVAQNCFDEQFGPMRFQGLGDRLRLIMRRPFFLDLALRSHRQFVGNRLWSGIFDEFLREHVGMRRAELDSLAKALVQSVSASGVLRREDWLKHSSPATRAKLRSARVLDDSDEFEHHLWRDYLFSRAISVDHSTWLVSTFDAATTFGTSPECLSMAVEQLQEADRIHLVKVIYDWNYSVALECVAHSSPTEEAERRLPESLRHAILAVVSEKLFDPIPRTSRRIRALLSQYRFAHEYLEAPNRDAVVHRVASIEEEAAWFATWKRLYSQGAGTDVQDADAQCVTERDSVIGWTAANLARRGILSEQAQGLLRDIYRHELGTTGRESVRWRIAHVLGRWPSGENIKVLAQALHGDSYHWVRYGAARALVECAAANAEVRGKAVESLASFVATSGAGGSARHMILQEIVEASFTTQSTPGWKEAVQSLLDATIAAETHDGRRETLRRRVRELQ